MAAAAAAQAAPAAPSATVPPAGVKSMPPAPVTLTLAQFKAQWQTRKLKQRHVPAAVQAEYAGKMLQAMRSAGAPEHTPQYVLLVDRNPHVQTLFIYAKPPQGPWEMAGAAPVSTGRTGRFDHYLTPLGVFPHSLANPDFRAEGTRNQKGVRGYGEKGMRVWDFGWANSERGWGTREPGTIRLLMHATDPALLESRLGQRASKGCVRISTELNRVLDQYGLLDADYDAALKQGQKLWVLRKDRQPVAHPGRYLVVVDSGLTEKPDWLQEKK
ncbi:L,D-transpeptidase [Massilia sp. W12]|uniref:L,D-transpeptidase n=1 Tax=Massilia sp. W12 TaxID=3126507 RepID=UPI0030CBD41F